jgi:hypothetical protein
VLVSNVIFRVSTDYEQTKLNNQRFGAWRSGEIEAQMFDKPLMLIEVRMLKFSTSAPILPNPC